MALFCLVRTSLTSIVESLAVMLGHTTRSLFHVREYAMSSIINAVHTAVSGLNAQSHAFTDLSNNIANSQTTGYKASTTSFEDYVTNNELANDGESLSDSVAATTRQHTDNQGMVTTSTNSTALAISGNGFFNVVQATGQSNDSTPVLGTQQYYTRNGDFSQDKNGYLVNTSGYYLEGYNVDATSGTLGTSLSAIQVPSTIAFRPTESTKLTATGTLDSSSSKTVDMSTTAYDSTGAASTVDLSWTKLSDTTWAVKDVNDTTGTSNSATVTFDSSGAVSSVTSQDSTGASSTSSSSFNYTGSPQDMTVSLSGVTLGSANTVSMTSDSVTTGTFSGISMETDGSVMATFDNGYSQLVAKIPLTTFADPNSLSAQNGQAYTATSQSGSPQINAVNTNGAGTLTTGSIEESTTDLTGDLSKLIVAQQAYGANTKVVSTADQLLQTTLAMIQ